MNSARVIPVLTVEKDRLVKTIKFKNPNYIGDPVNAVKIFNEKEVDEIILLDITATKENREPNYDKIEEICSEAFMPFAYGGGIKNKKQVDLLFHAGIEKVVLNSVLGKDLKLIHETASKYGSQSIVGSIDVKKDLFGRYQAYINSGKKRVKHSLEEYVSMLIEAGIGELFLNSIDRDGTYLGYDLKLIEQISSLSEVPLIASGGAGKISDFNDAISKGASAVAAGSLFVYSRQKGGILITYPKRQELL